MKHLPVSKQFETIKSQAKLEATTQELGCPVKSMILEEITPNDITPEIYPSLNDF